ncbi:MAG: methyltransferase domain-containing protein [Candidatus Eisenbacteria bacterium]|uniref:Methyltransferase domain-containing protein n=1 Tax=Eiseniibacteriota bacterium TaxID=2212470 RepID=A0A538T0J0_UNCEI|nr:MAG: methyltransferase domain-containing protein [Candidatus Eisenbacteria bacterium]
MRARRRAGPYASLRPLHVLPRGLPLRRSRPAPAPARRALRLSRRRRNPRPSPPSPQSFLPPDARVDRGSRGEGIRVGEIISDFGFREVLGIDIDARQIAKAEAAFATLSPERSIEFRAQDAEEMDPAQRYDFVLCTEVVEHTARPRRVIQNLAAVLAPEGVAVVTLPNAFSMPYALARAAHLVKRKPRNPVLEDHLRYPFWRALRLFDACGLDVVRTTGTNLCLDARFIGMLARTPFLPAVSRAQFAITRRWPLKYAAMFFCMVLKRRGSDTAPAFQRARPV